MASEKIKLHVIRRLKILSIPLYLLVDIVIWNIALFFIYKEMPTIYGLKIVFSVISFIFLFKYLKIWRINSDIRLASRVILIFFIISLIGSIIEIVTYSLINKIFMHTMTLALFNATINAVLLSCVFMFLFKIMSKNFELDENISTFYIPLIAKLGLIVYLFFSTIILAFLMNYVSVQEDVYLKNYSNAVLNEILAVSDNIKRIDDNIKSDMMTYSESVLNIYSNKNVISRDDIQNYFVNRIGYINNTLKNKYDTISVNINQEYIDTDLPYSVTVSKDFTTDRYTSRVSDALTIHNFLENEIQDNFVTLDINVYDRNNIYISAYTPLKLFGKDIGYMISETGIGNLNNIIKNNDILSKWSYIYYSALKKDIILSYDSRYLAESSSSILSSSPELVQNIGNFEKSFGANNSFEIFYPINIEGKKSIAIISYIKELKVIGLYY
ncbi:methyl-accepting chemotaxis protein, partial [Brachyspira hampsonii]|nr:methyl-accepting chemotaxis protein [Brachyspira hampsonii]